MMRHGFFLLASLMFLSAPGYAASISINAREYVLMDFHTGAVLAARNENERMAPSSMSKLMTTYMIFDALQSSRLSLDDELNVSANAWRKGGAASGGSTMFLEPDTVAKVEDLLRGVIIQSGNDACIVLAEALSGSEENFAAEMTIKGKEIGLTNSNFSNATGLPDENHYMSAHDLAVLAKRIYLQRQYAGKSKPLAISDRERSGRTQNRPYRCSRIRPCGFINTKWPQANYGRKWNE
jgi:D-alanyl-D-alanine carboxypeptidase (penicillin-binding protein 5/6)